MTLQWTAVAFFLYVEIAVILILCLPFISAQRYCIFSWRIWNWLSPYWNKGFFTMIMILIVLFLDAIREVQKYSGREPMQDAKANPNLFDHLHMKLFRSQRNLYISGFSLFLCIMRRVVTLLNQVAITSEESAGLQAQMDNAHKAAKQYQEDSLLLRQVRSTDSSPELGKRTKSEPCTVQRRTDDRKSSLRCNIIFCVAVRKSHAEVEAMKRQAKSLAQEYDRLLREHHKLQVTSGAADKKDQ
uniref:Endoplasmic reticulum transmembrane protein n=1 Tax=Myripristis murdjan TaxID=586833 RepID=A0A667ZMB0_9TELE